MDVDMDVDMDLDVGVDFPQDDDIPIEPEQPEQNAPKQAQVNPFDGTMVGAADIAFEKVHVRGLDDVDQRQLKGYISTHYDSPSFHRIEWIDDTSANFVYGTASAAAEALVAFTDTDIVDASALDTLELRPAKKMAVTRANGTMEQVTLQIRQATTSDVKKRGAHEASKFYLMNPDKDPRELRQRDRRDRGRSNIGDGDYRRMQFDDREHRRRRHEVAFSENMYDEDGGAGADSADDERRKRVRIGRKRSSEDLFAGRTIGRLRDRSASPFRGSEGDGRYGFGPDPVVEVTQSRRRVRQRSSSPPRALRASNAGKELFATRSVAPAAVELFPNKPANTGMLSSSNFNNAPSSTTLASSSPPKELFPRKRTLHRRSGAVDESPERYNSNTSAPPARPRSLAERISNPTPAAGSLAARITRDTAPSLASRITGPDADPGISIRGSGSGSGNAGISIRGNASGESGNASTIRIKGASGGGGPRELFPVKNSGRGGANGRANAGKELFGDAVQGRAARRTAASYF